MSLRVVIGFALIFQSAGFIGLHKIVDGEWQIISIALGIVGFVLLIYQARASGIGSDPESLVDVFDDGASFDSPVHHDALGDMGDHHF